LQLSYLAYHPFITLSTLINNSEKATLLETDTM